MKAFHIRSILTALKEVRALADVNGSRALLRALHSTARLLDDEEATEKGFISLLKRMMQLEACILISFSDEEINQSTVSADRTSIVVRRSTSHLYALLKKRIGQSAQNLWIRTDNELVEKLSDVERDYFRSLDITYVMPLVAVGDCTRALGIKFSRNWSMPGSERVSGLMLFVMQLVCDVAATALQKSNLKRMSERDLSDAREMQRRIFPAPARNAIGLTCFCNVESAQTVGGDFYDYIDGADGRLFIVAGDNSGKGIAAALLIPLVTNTLRHLIGTDHADLAGIVYAANRELCKTMPASRFATVFVAAYSPEQSELFYVNAGHIPPVLFKYNKKRGCHDLIVGGRPLGALFQEEIAYSEATIILEPGDLIVSVSDGAYESTDVHGREWGRTVLPTLGEELRDLSAEAACWKVVESIRTFARNQVLEDDRTVMILKCG